jgi:1-acylglycerone phosphate reductase
VDRCEEFATKGCKVYATARDTSKMNGLSAGIEMLTLDVLKDNDAHTAVEQIIEKEGRVDVLVNNVGALCIGERLQY